MKLLVGLGNPGPKYETTRHNAGFLLLDLLADEAGITWDSGQSKFGGDVGRGQVCGVPCVLLKPMTFMNLSGRSVAMLLQFFKISTDDLIVLHDDLDVPAGKVKAREGGGHGGHNGIRSIIECTGQKEFHRLKLGIGRPPEKVDPAHWVLAAMSDAELEVLQGEMLKEVKLRLTQIFDKRAARPE